VCAANLNDLSINEYTNNQKKKGKSYIAHHVGWFVCLFVCFPFDCGKNNQIIGTAISFINHTFGRSPPKMYARVLIVAD